MKDKEFGNIYIGRVGSFKKDCNNIRIDRKTILGNPFFMKHEEQRKEVCDKYYEYFMKEVKKEGGELRKEIIRLYKILLTGEDINLQCWCTPKQCHGETIKKFLECYTKQY